MTARRTQLRRIALPAALLTLSLLQACGSAPTKTIPPEEIVAPVVSQPEDSTDHLTLPPSPFAAQFAAADAVLIRGDWMSGAATLSPLMEADLNQDDADYLQYMLARVDYRRGELDTAHARLEQLNRPDLHPGIAYRASNFQRHLLGLQGAYLESARLGTRIMDALPESDQPAIKRSIWQDLQRCSARQINQALEEAIDANWRGWLELARIDNNSMLALGAELINWQGRYPDHPAAAPLPGGLELLMQAPSAPARVALVLPLSGRLAPAGKAVRDGYLASYFQARREGEAPGEILVIDSSLYTDAGAAYNDAILQGAQLVVGPLSKTDVGAIAAMPERPAPVIALNRIEQPVTPAGSAMVQLSLSPEDEARQLATIAFGQGARRALVLRPAGVWGDKIEAALETQWRLLGGTLVRNISYTGKDDYSAGVKAGLGIEASELRRRKIRDMLASNVEFTPRRRQDIDTIFMLSRTPEEARAIKPLLAFHYAGALPVYAASSIHGARKDARDRDLDGTRILEIPWVLGSDQRLRDTLAGSNSHQYSRLNALGVDAYRVQSRFAQLQAGPDALIKGDTGLLSLNPALQIERELPAAVFDGDQLKPL
jgi:outer membrane PBP1 activator LpoA protein